MSGCELRVLYGRCGILVASGVEVCRIYHQAVLQHQSEYMCISKSGPLDVTHIYDPTSGRWWNWKRSHLPDGLLTMITLPTKWATELASKPETGMGYQVVSVVLKDGKRFDQVVVVEGRITEIRRRKDIPFTADEVTQVILTHDRWNFNTEHGPTLSRPHFR